MTNEEAIKYLRQIYPHGGHCWLDVQRTEAISMAIEALSQEPASEDLEKAAERISKRYHFVEGEHVDDYALQCRAMDACIAGANWQKRQLMKDALETFVYTFNNYKCADFCGISRRLAMLGAQNGDRVKLIIIKKN